MWKNRSFIMVLLIAVNTAYASKGEIQTALDVGIVSASEAVVKPGLNLSLFRLSQGGPKVNLNEDLLVFKSRTLTGQLQGINPLIEELKLSYNYSEEEIDELIIKKLPNNQYLVEVRRVVKGNIEGRLLGLDISHMQNSLIEARGPGSGMASGRRNSQGAICGSFGICIVGKDNIKIDKLVRSFLQKHAGKIARYELIARSEQKTPLMNSTQGSLFLTVVEGEESVRVVGISLSEYKESSSTRQNENPLYKENGNVKTNPLYER